MGEMDLEIKNKFGFAARTASVLFALVIAVSAVPFGTFAAGADLRYGLSSLYCETYQPSDILGLIAGSYSTSEGAYLDTIDEYAMTFSPRIPDGYVSLSAYGTKMTVSASVYSYVADNGTTVSWMPSVAVHDGRTYGLTKSGNAYVATIDGIDPNASQTVRVEYSCSFALSASVTKEIANRAYNDAYSARANIQKYASALATYKTNLEKYNDFVNANTEYNTALAKYNKYLEELEVYNAALKKYQDYLTALDEYNDNLAKYQQYLKDIETYDTEKAAYDAAKEQYEKDKAEYVERSTAYLQYSAELKQAMEHLKYLELCYVTSDEGHNLLATLQGGTVSSVIDRKDELVLVGVSATDLNNCANATHELTSLLVDYSALKDDAARFNWYKNNYGALRSAISKLYSGLNSVYGNPTVRSQSAKQDRAYRFCQLLSQLYYLNTYLDDNVVADPNATINTYLDGTRTAVTYKLSEVLESAYVITDDNDSSVAEIILPEPVEKPVQPRFDKKEPKKPTPVYEPAAPKAVTEPTPIAEVEKPTAPGEIADPGEEPKEPEYSDLILALVDELDSGKLTSRNVTSGITISETSGITKILSTGDIHEYPIVTFLNSDGSLIDTVMVKDGKLERNVTANIPSDEKNAYFFDRWVNSMGQPVDFSTLKENITVYPTFKAVGQKYVITFITAEGTSTVETAYGKMPQCPSLTAKASDEMYDYKFVGWSPALKAVDGDATYEAVYEQSYRQYTIKWVIDTTTVESKYKYGEVPSCPIDPDSLLGVTASGVMTFAGWDKNISTVTCDTVYTAVIKKQWTISVIDGDNNDGVEIAETADNYVLRVPATVRSFDIGSIVRSIISYGKPMLIECSNGVSVEVPLSVLAQLMSDASYNSSVFGAPTDGNTVITMGYDTSDAEKSIKIMIGGKACPAGVTITFDCTDADNAIINGYSAAEGASLVETRIYRQANNIIMYTDGSSTSYAVVYSYAISVDQTDGGIVSIDSESARVGQLVNVRIALEAGQKPTA